MLCLRIRPRLRALRNWQKWNLNFDFCQCMVVITLTSLVSIGCTQRRFSPLTKQMNLDTLGAEGDPVSLPLVEEPTLNLVERTLEDLINSKAFVLKENVSQVTLANPSFQNFGSVFSAGSKVQVGPMGEGYTRYDVYKVNAGIGGSKILQEGNSLALPYGFSTGAEIRFARLFSSSAEADRAPSPNFLNLPVDAEKALLMAPGEFVSFPVVTNLYATVSGAFLQRSAEKVSKLVQVAKATLSGTFSGVREGKIARHGQFEYQVKKTTASKVRVRVSSQVVGNVNASISAQVKSRIVAVLFPNAPLERVKELGNFKRIHKLTSLKEAAEKAQILSTFSLPPIIASLENTPRFQSISPFAKDLAQGMEATKNFVDYIDKLNLTIDDVNKKTIDRVNGEIEAFKTKTISKIEHVTNFLLDLNAAVKLEGNKLSDSQLLFDFEFDLNQELGRLAYNRMLSGRVLLLAPERLSKEWNGKITSDVAFASSLATAEMHSAQPAVVRFGEFKNIEKSTEFNITFEILNLKKKFAEKWLENRINIVQDNGENVWLKIRQWNFSNGLLVGKKQRLESHLSALLFRENGTTPSNSMEWYLYGRDQIQTVDNPTSYDIAFLHLLNVLGSIGLGLNAQSLHQGNFLGPLKTNLKVAFNKQAIESFFDKSTTSDRILWSAFERLGAWYNVDNNLPYLAGPRAHLDLSTEYQSKACEKVQDNLGGGYCRYFAQKFLPKWEVVSQNPTDAFRTKFLEEFHSEGWLANKMGGDFLARFLIEVLYAKHGEDALKFMSIDFSATNSVNESIEANPSFTFGNNPILSVQKLLSEDLVD